MAVVFGKQLSAVLVPIVKELVDSENKYRQSIAGEMFAGLVRAVKHVDCEEYRGHILTILGILNSHSWCIDYYLEGNMGVDAIDTWCYSIRYGVSNRDPRRYTWLQEKLLLNAFDGNRTTTSRVKQLKMIDAMLQEFSWKNMTMNSTV